MMPKWWIEQGQPVEIFEQSYLSKGSQVVWFDQTQAREIRDHTIGDVHWSEVGGELTD